MEENIGLLLPEPGNTWTAEEEQQAEKTLRSGQRRRWRGKTAARAAAVAAWVLLALGGAGGVAWAGRAAWRWATTPTFGGMGSAGNTTASGGLIGALQADLSHLPSGAGMVLLAAGGLASLVLLRRSAKGIAWVVGIAALLGAYRVLGPHMAMVGQLLGRIRVLVG